MPATLLDGNALAKAWKERIRTEAAGMRERGVPLRLVSIRVGDNPAAALYTKNQRRACEEAGLEYELECLPGDSRQEALVDRLVRRNLDASVTGIMLQVPLPPGWKSGKFQALISPDKDVEGVHPASMGLVLAGATDLVSCTARAAYEIVRSTGVTLRGKEAVIVGHSEIVGKPLALLLLNDLATPTVCHIGTIDLAAHTRRADLLFVAVGKPGLIRADMVKPGAVVVDIGISRVPILDGSGRPVLDEKGAPKTRIVGDVDFEGVKEVAGFLTPVPGGVGPMTVAMLLENTILAAKRARRIPSALGADPETLRHLFAAAGRPLDAPTAAIASEIFTKFIVKVEGDRAANAYGLPR